MEQVITDRAGRRLTLRKVGVLETVRLFKALGPVLSANDAYMGMASYAVAVAMLDDVPLPFPVNEAGVEALLERLGADGIDAVMGTVQFRPAEQVAAEAGN
jgi:hypothetical protein